MTAAVELPWSARVWAAPLGDPRYRDAVWRRVLVNVRQTDSGCWEWQRYRNEDGYGIVSVKRRMTAAHKVTMAIHRGSLWPEPLQVDHLCRNRACCNPAHLEIVTPAVNAQRSMSGVLSSQRIKARTRCPQNHPYDEVNTRIRRYGYRDCRTCERARAVTPVTCPLCGQGATRSNLPRHQQTARCRTARDTCGRTRAEHGRQT